MTKTWVCRPAGAIPLLQHRSGGWRRPCCDEEVVGRASVGRLLDSIMATPYGYFVVLPKPLLRHIKMQNGGFFLYRAILHGAMMVNGRLRHFDGRHRPCQKSCPRRNWMRWRLPSKMATAAYPLRCCSDGSPPCPGAHCSADWRAWSGTDDCVPRDKGRHGDITCPCHLWP